MLIACSISTVDQVENASFAWLIEHVHNLTVILPHRMQGMATSMISDPTSLARQSKSAKWPAIMANYRQHASQEEDDGAEGVRAPYGSTFMAPTFASI